MIAGLSQVAHRHFERLERRLDLVDDELVKYTARCPPGRGKRNGTRIFAILCVESGAFIAGGDDPEVVWIGRREEPRPIAPSLAAFLEAWADAAFCVPLVLRRARVPGWGA